MQSSLSSLSSSSLLPRSQTRWVCSLESASNTIKNPALYCIVYFVPGPDDNQPKSEIGEAAIICSDRDSRNRNAFYPPIPMREHHLATVKSNSAKGDLINSLT